MRFSTRKSKDKSRKW